MKPNPFMEIDIKMGSSIFCTVNIEDIQHFSESLMVMKSGHIYILNNDITKYIEMRNTIENYYEYLNNED